jgi:hypothetical protein
VYQGSCPDKDRRLAELTMHESLEHLPVRGGFGWCLSLVPLTANKGRKSYAASVKGFASSIWHLAMTFATDFEVQLNG